MAKTTYLTLNIKGLEWKIYVQTPAAYKRKHGSDSAAITYYEDKVIYFRTDHVKYGSCLHELGHALVYSSGTTSAQVSSSQMEEHIWELLEEHYFDLGNWTRQAHDFLAKQASKC